MGQITKIIKNKKIQKFVFSFFLTILLFGALFLTFKLYKFYVDNVRINDSEKLLYDFKENTIGYSNSDFYKKINNETYISYKVSYGIDVSEWQGVIDWQKVKNTGISFAMIRCGFREISGNNVIEDSRFKYNIEEASKAGLRVGVYFYGTAKNEEEAIEEAEFTVNLIKDYELSYPIAYDTESLDNGRLTNIDYSTLSDVALTYTEHLEGLGYSTMIYSFANAFRFKFDTGKFDGKLMWVANFSEENWYTGTCNMWQYTDAGRVDGIVGNVDLDISYFEYVENEYEITPTPENPNIPTINFTKSDDTLMTKANAVIRNSATTEVPNKLGTIQSSVEVLRIGKSKDFSKVLYKGKVVYIKNSDLMSP